ncbi:DUF4430 domain-containing protein [Anaerocolumna xylanovorans]|uniref:Transcobalamin-like C-terminal domain-containing protein n=1 Tax=Anaerocolumna xylanovorans DSM 12503 TaxID=1121345 RepID=A0A1M7YDQ1_9FIRM|nr:DUF4430 domain-containing protein [Anaerocolumna xylanovorans]SHO50723.1 protein of unknown function [Anaerocolumna xylanovorans DSM 12503]
MENKKSMKKPIIGLIIFVAVIAAMAILYNVFKPETQEGSKHIVAEVVLGDGTSKTFDINTDAEFLRKALEEKKLISGDETQYGLFVKTVDGVTVDESKKEWWCFTKDKKALDTGVDTTPISDGDHFEITLTTG